MFNNTYANIPQYMRNDVGAKPTVGTNQLYVLSFTICFLLKKNGISIGFVTLL